MDEEQKLLDRTLNSRSLKEFNENLTEYQRKTLDRCADSNTERQRRRRLTQTERSREAIDRMASHIKSDAEKMGKEMTADQARRKAQSIAEVADKKQGK
jgi:DNA-binding MarR family transcriptional regulator